MPMVSAARAMAWWDWWDWCQILYSEEIIDMKPGFTIGLLHGQSVVNKT